MTPLVPSQAAREAAAATVADDGSHAAYMLIDGLLSGRMDDFPIVQAFARFEQSIREDGWQTIDTAPLDGTEFIAWGDGDGGERMAVVFYDVSVNAPDLICADGTRFSGAEWHWAVMDGSTLHRDCFTHWRPLLTRPAIRKGTPA